MWGNLAKLWEQSGLVRGATVVVCLVIPASIALFLFLPSPPNPGGGNSTPATNQQANAGNQPAPIPATNQGNTAPQNSPTPSPSPGTGTQGTSGTTSPSPLTKIPLTPPPKPASTQPLTPNPPSTAKGNTNRPSVFFPSKGTWQFIHQRKVEFEITIDPPQSYNDGQEEVNIDKYYTEKNGAITFWRRNVGTGESTEFLVGRYYPSEANPQEWEFKQLQYGNKIENRIFSLHYINKK